MPKTSLPVIPPLPVLHYKQAQLSDCLAACAARYSPPRCAAPHPVGSGSAYHEATLAMLIADVQAGYPVIAFVDTGELSYWSTATNHAVVVIGFDNDQVIVNDPAFDTAPQSVPCDEFELAWLSCDNACAVIKKPSQ